MVILNKFNTSVYPVILDNGQPLFQRREMIQGFIRKNLPFLDSIYLANPKLKEDKIEFSTDLLYILKPIEDFTLNEKNEVLQRYNKAIYQIEDFFLNYAAGDSQSIGHWEKILKSVFHPANNLIYANGENIVLLWGCNFFNEEENYLPREQVAFDLDQETEEMAIPGEETVDEQNIPIEEEVVVSSVVNAMNSNVPSPNKTDNIIHVRSNKHNPRSFLNRFFTGVIDFLKRGWWFILLFLLLFIWLNDQYCMNCDNYEPIVDLEKEIAQIYLPPRQGISVPIDSLDIGYDQDSLFIVANNRINVALKNKQEDFYAFINELGTSFLNTNREIIYYNEETCRIQVLFDQDQDPDIRNELRKAVSDFELLIWDESIFISSFQGFNDPFLSQPEVSWYLKAIKMDKAWLVSTGSKDVVVAVIDDGFDLTHPELKNTAIVKKYNVVEQRNQVYGNALLSHGTHVSTILLGAKNNNQGLIGIAPDVSFMPIQIGSQTNTFFSFTDIIDGVLYALKNNADVINLSLGKQFSPAIESLPEYKQKELIANLGTDEAEFWAELFKIADKQNTTIVIAAGNSGILSGIDPMQRYENTIIVGAVDRRMKFAEFSNYGDFNTIQAPGVQIVSAIPGNTYAPMDGTSMAAPIVSGAVALYKSLYPNATNKEIKSKLVQTAQQGGVINVELILK